MGWEWTTEVGMFIQEDRLPKAIHFFQVYAPIVLDSLLKNRAKEIVLTNGAVKLID
ncbi:hypothetical protein D3C81_1389500 [compost metagenome]